ncbi:MAG: hypothetical protein SFX73_00140 [Kofleriaceae bacterium]|nr:hypothetical protein [Kofleriaceae bacterium]
MTPTLVPIAPRSRFAFGGAHVRCAKIAFAATSTIPIVLLVLLVTPPQRRFGCFSSSKEDIAKATVNKFAHEAYVQWAHENPGLVYPKHLGELSEYMNSKSAIDPWDSPYFMQRAQRGIVVMSAGPDRVFGTSDDFRSDD